MACRVERSQRDRQRRVGDFTVPDAGQVALQAAAVGHLQIDARRAKPRAGGWCVGPGVDIGRVYGRRNVDPDARIRSRVAVVLVAQAQQHLGHVGVQRVGDVVDLVRRQRTSDDEQVVDAPVEVAGVCAAADEHRAFTDERLLARLGVHRDAIDEDRLLVPFLVVTERQVYPLAGGQRIWAADLVAGAAETHSRSAVLQQPQGQALQVAVGGGAEDRLDRAGDGIRVHPGHHGEAGVVEPQLRGGGSRFAGRDLQRVADAIEVGGKPVLAGLAGGWAGRTRGVVEPAAAVDEARRAAGFLEVQRHVAVSHRIGDVRRGSRHHCGIGLDLWRWQRDIAGRLDAVQPHRAGVGFGAVSYIVAGLDDHIVCSVGRLVEGVVYAPVVLRSQVGHRRLLEAAGRLAVVVQHRDGHGSGRHAAQVVAHLAIQG